MALNPHLKELVDNGEIGFEDVFELYAVLCVNHVTDTVNDMIADEGIDELVKGGMSFTAEAMTGDAIDWGHYVVPQMLADMTEDPKKPTESLLQYTIRRKIEQHVEEVKSFQIKVV